MNERVIFDAALEIADPQARRSFIEKACDGKPEMLAAVETLLTSHDEAGSFLNVPVIEQKRPDPASGGDLGDSSKSSDGRSKAGADAASVRQQLPSSVDADAGSVGHEDKTHIAPAGMPGDDDPDDETLTDLGFLQPSSKPGSIGVLGHYEVLSVLGQGAFGIVFKAFDEKLHRLVAIKVMNPQMASTSPPRKRFLREARSAAAIKHENIVQVYSVEEQPLPYLVMEFIDGQTLKQKLDGSGPLETPEVLHIARQIASGLAAAQAMGLIHRDIKPANILLEQGAEQRVKISDFGLARAADDASMTRTGVISGTPMYMAPEQATGQSLDHRADLFSLGSVLYQMACGRPPFRAATTVAVLRRVVEDTPRPLQEIIPEIPDWLVAIVTKLHAKNPEDRFQSAKEVAELLARCQSELQLNGKVTCVTAAERVARPESSKGVESQPATPFAKPQGVPPDQRSTDSNRENDLTSPTMPTARSADFTRSVKATLDYVRPESSAPSQPKLRLKHVLLILMVAVLSGPTLGVILKPYINRWLWPPIPTLPATEVASGLQFDGKDDYVKVGPINLSSPQYTLEAFVTSAKDGDNGVIALLKNVEKDPELMYLYDGYPAGQRQSGAGIIGQRPYQSVNAPLVGGACEHRALVFDGSAMHYYVNGIWQGKRHCTARKGLMWEMRELYIGCKATETEFFRGQIDQLRLSKIARYSNNFTVEPRLKSDDSTLALYNFDEGQGDVLNDASGHGHHGKIVGATWVSPKSSSSSANPQSLTSKPSTSWHGWSADAPPPAIAPFDAEQAKQHQDAWAKYLGVPVEYTNSLGMKFRLIPPGEFLMGSTKEEIETHLREVGDKYWNELIRSAAPQHKVSLTEPIYLGINEVTQAAFETVMGRNPSHFAPMGMGKEAVTGMETADHPVDMMSWNDAAEFCAKLSKREKFKPYYFRAGETVTPLDGTGYRLPSEAEWEFACRAGTTTKYWIGDKDQDLVGADWSHENSGGRTHAAGELKANPFSLSDMHGNVYEWVQDAWDATYYGQFQDKPAINPNIPFSTSSNRVIRGGGWQYGASNGRSSIRHAYPTQTARPDFGFRVALMVDAVRMTLKLDGPKIVKPGVPVGANGNPVAEQGRSAWDDLDPAQIPEAERVPRQPEGLVAVLGQHRRRFWGLLPYTMSASHDGDQYSVTTVPGLSLFGRDPKQPTRFFNIGHTSAVFLADGKIAVGEDTGGIPNGGAQLTIFAKPRDGMPLEKQTATNAQILAAMQAPLNGEWLAGYERFEDGAFGIGLWKLGDAPPQRAVKFALPKPSGMAARISFSPDGHWFCFTHEDKSESLAAVHLIDLRSDPPREAIVLKAEADEKSDAPAKGFLQAAFLSDGRLATADDNGRTWFWKINDGEPQRVGSIRDTGNFAVAARSLRLIVGLGGTQFRVWDLAADPPQLLCSSPQFDSSFNTQAIAPNGETVLTGHVNGAARFWNVSKAGVTELDPLAPNPSFVGRQFKVIDRFLCASTEASRVGVWRPTPDGLQALPMESPSLLVVGASSAQRQLIVREPGTGGGTVLLRCDADRISPIRRITGDNVASAALNDEGNRLAIGRHNGMDEVLELWGWESDKLPARKLAEVKSPESVQQLAFVEAGRALVGRVGLRLQMWDVKDDQLIPRASLPTRQFNQFALAPDGQTLVTASYGNPLELWNLKSDLTQPTTSFAIPEANAVAFSPDGRRLAASFWESGASAGVQIIHLASGVVEKRLTFPGRVSELTFTDDSRHLITGNANGTIYVVRLEPAPKTSPK